MARLFGWGTNAGNSLGDVKNALAGRAFGAGANLSVVGSASPAKLAIDASLGEEFVIQMAASSAFKIGNPTNYGDGTQLLFHIVGITSFGTLVWDTLYQLTGSIATFSTGKTKSIAFRYNSKLGKFTELYRTTTKS